MIAFDPRFFRFLIAGTVSIPFNVTGRVLLSTVVDFRVAVVGAQLIGMLVAYCAMKVLVFEASGRSTASELVRFGAVNAFSLAQTWGVSVSLLAIIPVTVGPIAYREFGVHVFGLGTTAVTSFLLHRSFSFRKKRPSQPALPLAAPATAPAFAEVDHVI